MGNWGPLPTIYFFFNLEPYKVRSDFLCQMCSGFGVPQLVKLVYLSLNRNDKGFSFLKYGVRPQFHVVSYFRATLCTSSLRHCTHLNVVGDK